ncbi:MAG: hypothetical protein PUG10_01445 [Lachnospiraceae bacterium]|nr:hypothetical protein [Lachnospiraceae bacterium]
MKGLLKYIDILSIFILKPLVNKMKKSPVRFFATMLVVLSLLLFPVLLIEKQTIQIMWGNEILGLNILLSIVLMLVALLKKKGSIKNEKIKFLSVLSGDIHKAFIVYQWDVYLKQAGIYLLIGVICLLKIRIQFTDAVIVGVLFLLLLKWAMDIYYLFPYLRKGKKGKKQILISYIFILLMQILFLGLCNWFSAQMLIVVCVAIQEFIICITKKKIYLSCELNYSDILEETKTEWTKGKGFQRIYELCRICSPKTGVYAAKEIVQILNETIPLVSANVMTIIVSIIMLVATPLISQDALKLGLVISISYFSFLVGLNTFPREIKYLWIVKSVGGSLRRLMLGKIIGCILMGMVGSVIYGAIYCIIGSLFFQIQVSMLIPILRWSIVTSLPIGCSLGIILGCCMPYQIMEKEKEIDYKYNGLESSFLFLNIFFVAIPVLVSGGFLYDIDLIILKVICIGMTALLLVIAQKMLSKKIIKNE